MKQPDSEYDFDRRPPWWFSILLVVFTVVGLVFSTTAAQIMTDAGWGADGVISWFYPAYMIIAAVCSWITYHNRRALSWILFTLIVLTDLGIISTFIL